MISGLSMQAMMCGDAQIPRAQGCAGAGDLHRTATLLTGFDIDPEHAFETLGPRHGAVFFQFSQVLVGRASLTALCRGDLRAKPAVRCEDPMIAREVDAGPRDERRQSSNKIQGLEEDVGGAVSPGRLERIAHLPLAGE